MVLDEFDVVDKNIDIINEIEGFDFFIDSIISSLLVVLPDFNAS